jgi:hypothetical protein
MQYFDEGDPNNILIKPEYVSKKEQN